MHTSPTLAPTLGTPPPALLALPAPASAAPPVILFGRDDASRPHASRFGGVDRAGAEEAARHMGLHCALAASEALRDLAARLPAGRLFPASGKAFVPFVAAGLYDRLLATTGTLDRPKPIRAASKAPEAGAGARAGQGSGPGGAGAGDPASPGGKGSSPPLAPWTNLSLGSLVLAQDDDEGGYYPAKVVATKADDHVQLVWHGYPDLPEFARARWSLALLHPEAAARVLTP